MQVDTAKLKLSTKSFAAAVVSAGTLFEIPPVHDCLLAAATNHPHVTGVLGTVFALAALLHNPQMQDALGIKTTVTQEVVQVAPAAETDHGA